MVDLVDRIGRRTGLSFEGCHRDRMIEAVVETPQGALAGGDPYAALLDRLTVGETYFFREPSHLRLLTETVLPSLVERRGPAPPVAVWSAGCASGEEPYSIAIRLAEHGALDRARIVGTDLSPRAVARGRAAVYGRWSLRRCDSWQQSAYFHRVGDRFHLRDRYVSAVELVEMNLLDGPPAHGAFDLVLCRNVLMYLTDAARRAAARSLRDALAPGGWLVLGASDPLLEGEGGLVRTATQGGIVYRRCDVATSADVAPPSVVASPQRTRRAPRRRPARRVDQRTEALDPTVDELAERVRTMAVEGDLRQARDLAARAIELHPLDARLRYRSGIVELLDGRPAEAARAAAAAIYLEPDLVLAHVLLAHGAQQCGDDHRARRSFANAVDLLALLPPTHELRLGDGVLAGDVLAALESHRRASGSSA